MNIQIIPGSKTPFVGEDGKLNVCGIRFTTTPVRPTIELGVMEFDGIGFHFGIFPRLLVQSEEPTSGTGPTQVNVNELVMWNDTANGKVYFIYNLGGSIKKLEIK